MLKWTIPSRRDTSDKPARFSSNFPSADSIARTPLKKKRRCSSAGRRASNHKRFSLDALDDDKENQFHSTPIKNTSVQEAFSPFRDLSNVASHQEKARRISSPKYKVKKKKECLEAHQGVGENSNYFTPFEAVDSHIESYLAELCSCKAPNVPTDLEAEPVETPAIEDAADQATLPGFRAKKLDAPRVSPLVKKILELQFSRSSKEANDSSFINDLSLDKLVDALLENSSAQLSPSASMVVNIHSKDLEKVCDAKEEENENENGLKRLEVHSAASSDSGFKSSPNENPHQMDSNFVCKCNNNNLTMQQTIIPINETYNERCVDGEVSRKRTSLTPVNAEEAKKPKVEIDHTLKRQKCIRRRKAEHFRQKLRRLNSSVMESATVSPFWSNQKQFFVPSDEESFSSLSVFQDVENTPLRGCYLENKNILSATPLVEPDANKPSRKCLLFSSPATNESTSFADSTVRSAVLDVRGSLDLRIFSNGESIYVALADSMRSSGSKKKNAVLQRTSVQSNSSRPIFNHTFKFPKLPASSRKRINIEVWHRDRTTMSSDFLGCMSFDVEDALGKGIEGSYRLLPQGEGRLNHAAITNGLIESSSNMGENNQESCAESVLEEILSLDGIETELKRSTNKTVLSEQQKHADEHLFLRYLELDPIEGPDAIPAAMQRKATGNKFGRTPFTQTKRLIRPAKSGFGFSVVWTHPPRIERVEKGLPAERAGILPGDYIIFVDKHNVVMMPEIDILNLIRSYGSQLTLEIFRRNPSRNGSVPNVHQKTATLVAPSSRTNSNLNLPGGTPVASALRRPSTVCSTNTTSMDYRRRKLNLPQVTFSSEKPTTTPEESRKRTIYQLISKEQQYATCLQFAITRFVSALAERRDLLTASEHKVLFQNSEEILRITEDILDHLVHEDGEMDASILSRVYRCKLHEITSAYKRYCSGIKKADCVLANKMKNSNSDFVKFIQCPAIPRRRPDLTTFIHKPLEHYREALKILMAIQGHTPPKHEDFSAIGQIVHEMQPFVLNKPGRQWIFGGDLGRVEGRNVRQYWTLLFSDLILFARASRDRVLFITEDPLPLAHVTDMVFNVRKKGLFASANDWGKIYFYFFRADTEFRICTNSDAKRQATSPTIHCGPDLSRTPKKNSCRKTVILRAPTMELKAVWQNLLQRQ
ncbi:hypothetical protein YQE_11640, partial [Dendroctonus ponderosae]